MSVTATGPILLLILLYFFVSAPQKLTYCVIFFAPFSATAIINLTALGYKSGGLGLTPAMMSLILIFAAQVIFGFSSRPLSVSYGHLLQIGLIFLFVGEVLVSMVANGAFDGTTSFQITQTVYLFIGLLATVVLSLELARPGGIETAVRAARAACIFVSAWGLVQLACFFAHIPYPSILFNNSQSDAAGMFDQTLGGSYMRIASVAVEPSVLATSLLHYVVFGATVMAYDRRIEVRYWLLPVAFGFIVLVLSSSTTAYFGLALLAGLLLLTRPFAAIAAGVPAMAVGAAALVAIPRFRSAFFAMTVDKGQTSSYLERVSGGEKDFATFLSHPLLGGGWGTASNFNALSALLSNVGVFGTALFLIATGATLWELTVNSSGLSKGPHWRLPIYAAGVRNAIIVASICGIPSGMKYVFPDDWVWWGFGIALASRMALLRLGTRDEAGHATPHVSRPSTAVGVLR